MDVELVNLRVSLKSQVEDITLPVIKNNHALEGDITYATLYGIDKEVPILNRDELSCGEKIIGPVLITETVSTTYLAPGWSCEVDKSGCLLLYKL